MASIAVVGTGYVGLATGACLADLGHEVRCLDVDATKVDALQSGVVPIVEHGLDVLVEANLEAGRLSFSVEIGAGISDADFVFLCLPTPQGDDGSADLSYIMGTAPVLSEALPRNAVIVNKSTVPVGTAQELRRRVGRDDISIVSNPEFLRQGSAVNDFLHPTRIVIGGENQSAVDAVGDLYHGVDAPILKMSSESAETLKYAANSLLATKLTFINAIADICELVGADIRDVAEGIGLDPRIGRDMLNAGPGWGGSCFPKDTRALVSIAREAGYDFALLRGVIETNDSHYVRIVDKVSSMCGNDLRGKAIAAWGLTFKAGTDDLRDSPAIKILSMLRDRGATIRASDPTSKGTYSSHPWIEVIEDPTEVCRGAECLALLTEWPEFTRVDPQRVGELLTQRKVVDARNVLDRDRWISAGFHFSGVGR